MPEEEHMKNFKYYCVDFQINTQIFLHHFQKGNKEIFKKLVRGERIFKKLQQKPKEEGRGTKYFMKRMGFFIFTFSLLALMISGTAFQEAQFRRYSFFKKSGLQYLKHWLNISFDSILYKKDQDLFHQIYQKTCRSNLRDVSFQLRYNIILSIT